jgi:hypothetical protein
VAILASTVSGSASRFFFGGRSYARCAAGVKNPLSAGFAEGRMYERGLISWIREQSCKDLNRNKGGSGETPQAVRNCGGSAWFTGDPAEEVVQARVAAPRLHLVNKNKAEGRDAQGEFHSAAEARAYGLATATSVRTTALLSTAWAARLIRAGRAASSGWRRRLCARPCSYAYQYTT